MRYWLAAIPTQRGGKPRLLFHIDLATDPNCEGIALSHSENVNLFRAGQELPSMTNLSDDVHEVLLEWPTGVRRGDALHAVYWGVGDAVSATAAPIDFVAIRIPVWN